MKEIPLLKVFMDPSVPEETSKVLMSGWIGQGKKVDEFEYELSKLLKVPTRNVLTTNSGTSALNLALRLANIKPGDEVISTVATCLATNCAILEHGAKIIWADVDYTTGLIDPRSAEKKITRNTKAIMCVDWTGRVCEMDLLSEIAKENEVFLIVDGAQSLGATYRGQHSSAYADFVMHSFQAVKQVTTGDGGVLVCKTRETADRGRLLRWYGLDRENTSVADPRCEQCDVKEFGYKMHMNDISATIGLCNLRTFPERLRISRENRAFYDNAFCNQKGVDISPKTLNSEESPWAYTIRLMDLSRVRLDELMNVLRMKGIGRSILHTRSDQHSAFKSSDRLIGVEEWYKRQLHIPVGWWVTKEDREFIAKTILSII